MHMLSPLPAARARAAHAELEMDRMKEVLLLLKTIALDESYV